MAIGSTIPSVLVPGGKLSSISTERALKQIKELLENMEYRDDDALYDSIMASIDDVDVMLMCIER